MDVADLTRDLVAIPSHEDEAAAGEYVADWLREYTDAAVEVDEHGNVFGRVGAGEETLALTGHHDVVAPDDSQVRDGEYVIREDDGRLYGRGTADMKGSLAAMLCAFRDADREALDCELVVASFVAEEEGALGSKWAVADGFAPDYAVVGEGSTGYSAPGVTDVAVAHKGRRGSTITAVGEAAHASETEAGVNAIYRATDAVDVVRDLPAPSATVLGHDVTGSVAVTEIEGGSAWNVIPDACSVTVDERTVPGDRAPLERVESIEGVEWTVDQDLPPMACGDADFADLALDVAREVQAGETDRREENREADSGGPPEHVVKPHATDAGRLATAGTDCLVIGAAEPGEAHTADESVSLAVLDRCYEIYLGIAERI